MGTSGFNLMVVPLMLMVVSVLAEAGFNRWRGQAVDWRDVGFNFNVGQIILWLGRTLEIAVFVWVYQAFSGHWLAAWPAWASWLFVFVAWDFCFYVLHRAHHRWRWLWWVHEVHHTGQHFNLSLGVRNAWYSSLTSVPFFLILALLGATPLQFVLVSTAHYAIQLFNHNSVLRGYGPLEWLLVSPNLHRVHHGHAEPYLNKNFGGTLSIWDRLLGTYQPLLPQQPPEFGVKGSLATHNPLKANHAWLARWRQEAPLVASAMPKPMAVLAMSLALFGLVLYYIAWQFSWTWWQQGFWVGLLAVGSVAIGAWADGQQRLGLHWWCVGIGALGMLAHLWGG
ncbi:MAG: sterol desaturase family protein [Neisseriaceae bacterium]|nr:sterol desaturase family protein [Neisseriaceae bacterium]